MTLRDKIAEAVEADFYATYRGDKSFSDTADAILDVIREGVKPLSDRLMVLDDFCARADRSGPSAKGYVTDATFNHWCGERSALREALRILSALGIDQ